MTPVKEVSVESSDFNKYQGFVDKTAIHRDDIYPVLGLAGETGEFVELVKKAWRKDGAEWADNFDRMKAKSELGDILWYVARIGAVLEIPLDDIVADNMAKLLDRVKNGKKENS
jgi:NTP pyrophosphatase (non-canonical NTP hydrolase)